MISEPKVAYRNKLLLFWLSACLGIIYSTPYHYTFKLCAPQKWGAHFISSAPALRTLAAGRQ